MTRRSSVIRYPVHRTLPYTSMCSVHFRPQKTPSRVYSVIVQYMPLPNAHVRASSEVKFQHLLIPHQVPHTGSLHEVCRLGEMLKCVIMPTDCCRYSRCCPVDLISRVRLCLRSWRSSSSPIGMRLPSVFWCVGASRACMWRG